ncbi:hypothetical protein Tco_1413315 [Tanacetum coccineum]
MNDRYVEGMHALPPPMTGIYIPSGPDIEIDDSQITYGPKQSKPSKSDARSSDFTSCKSNTSEETHESMPKPVVNESSVVSQPKVWSDAPIIEEYESDSEDEHVSLHSKEQETPRWLNRLNKVSSPDGDHLVIYKANGNFRAFNYLLEVLYIFDRQDLFHLYDLVMKQYSEVTLEGNELILWGDLKITTKSSKEENDQSDFWNIQQNWEIVRWRLYKACGVYILELEDGTIIHMLIERRYPLSKELLQRMLDFGLEVEVESTVALDLIRVLNSPCFMVKSWLVQDQTVLGKDYSNLLIADSLLKTIWFINAPCYGNEALASPKANGLTIPEQTATGKGISNPFMAGSLPKTTKPT